MSKLLQLVIFWVAISGFGLTQVGIIAQYDEDLARSIERIRNRDRGPYTGIKWFCATGEVRHPQIEGPCPTPDPDNKQHGELLPELVQLGRNQHLFLTQVLTGTDRSAFWDRANDHSRMKQYMLSQYLERVDHGWIRENVLEYRGALQAEDEQEWGRDFLTWLLRDREVLEGDFYLLREAVKDIPHRQDDDRSAFIRDESRRLSELYSGFMPLRVRIHGQPSLRDAEAVRRFAKEHTEDLQQQGLLADMDSLANSIEIAFSPEYALSSIDQLVGELRNDNPTKEQLQRFVAHFGPGSEPSAQPGMAMLTAASDLMLDIREQIVETRYRQDRLRLLDISVELERLLFRASSMWVPDHARELMEKTCYLTQAATGAGLLELWEYETVAQDLSDLNYQYVLRPSFEQYVDRARRAVEWGSATNRSTFGPVVDRYLEFEPLAQGFLDDRIRGSVLLPLGEAAGTLSDWLGAATDLKNDLPAEVQKPTQMRGVNPGYAKGTLYLIDGEAEDLEVDPKGIYVFARPPADLKPVAGIASVSEGNLVSHVQLLARNLGIPNAVITEGQLDDLRSLAGQELFYAVSPAGTVVLRKADEMSDEEQALFAEDQRAADKVTVAVDRLDLENRRILNMRQVDSRDSGVRSGPKAANLGQLKQMYPDRVVEGLVIPFGIFRAHLDQPMPGQTGQSYWTFLNERFDRAQQMEVDGHAAEQVDAYLMNELTTMREAIEQIELQPQLVQALRDSFVRVFGQELGRAAVFLRSDTNMEDLPDFTGAGLNLTLFNVVDEQDILDGIKRIWASPYTERSYRWRQRYLENPENVFPSILIIPTVDVESSGVVITKGILDGNPHATTVAFSRGAGGAVEGQAAESYRLGPDGQARLLSPARERIHRRLPASGGSDMIQNNFSQRILSPEQLAKLHELSMDARRRMPGSPGIESDGPWDIELGFEGDKIWLFQIRPFVENDRALSSNYLESISPTINEREYFNLEHAFK